jgi:hypothetical protein
MDPDFDFWDLEVRKYLTDFFVNSSPKALTEFKKRYSRVLPEPARSEVQNAVNRDQLNAAFEKLGQGRKHITFKIHQVYKGINTGTQMVDLSTSFDDCGTHFIKGETYLVYADMDKTELGTGACSRTRRLSEAADDLVYLQFVQNGQAGAARVWGFVSSDMRVLKLPQDSDSTPAPVPNVFVRLHSAVGTLLARTENGGKFAFDGLSTGDYDMVVTNRLDARLSAVRRVHVGGSECKVESFYVSRTKLPLAAK